MQASAYEALSGALQSVYMATLRSFQYPNQPQRAFDFLRAAVRTIGEAGRQHVKDEALRVPYFETFIGQTDGEDKFFWRLRAANGETLCVSEGYRRVEDRDHAINIVANYSAFAPVKGD